MKPTTPKAPAPIVTWTVWLHAQYHAGHTEVWTGSEYDKSLSVAIEVINASETVEPLDHAWTVAAHAAGERTTNCWRITTADDESALVFITTRTTNSAS